MRSFAELAERMKSRGERVLAAAEQETDKFADFLVERGKANAPVLSGRLQASVHKESPAAPAGMIVRDIVADMPYALEVHERQPEQDHAHEGENTAEGFPGRQYLSRPLRFHRDAFGRSVRNGVAEALRGGPR